MEDGPRLSYVIGRLDRTVRTELERRLQPFGVSVSQYTAMSILRRTTGLSNAQLARRTYVTPQAMMQVTSGLEAAGLIGREPSPAHKRVLQSRLTAEGDARLDACDAAVDAMEAEMLEGVDDADRDQIRALLVRCVRNLHGGLDAG